MKRLAYLILLLATVACKKEVQETTPSVQTQVVDGTDVVKVDPKAVEFTSTDRRRFNGNGNGNGGQNTDTTSNWTVNIIEGDWDVTWDTSVCGFLIMRWDDVKPATTTLSDSIYISNYGLEVDPIPSTCPGVAVCLTNLFWTKYGTTCAIKPSSTYRIRIGWARYDKTREVCDKYFSEWVDVTTGILYQDCK
jgi:hypothetical protein